MKKIKMLDRSDVAMVPGKGPINFRAHQEYVIDVDIDAGNAASLVGRGKAKYISEEEVIAATLESLEALTVPVLRKLAQKAGIAGYGSMNRTPLLEALAPKDEGSDEGSDEE